MKTDFVREGMEGEYRMKVNGQEVSISRDMTLEEFLRMKDYDVTRVAVERNLEIVPSNTFSQVILDNEDTLEVVSFVGGG